MAVDIKSNFSDWTNERLIGKDSNHISGCVAEWNQKCYQLAKKLDEDYPDAAEVARELRTSIEEFSKNLPLIRCFTSEAITEEDWKEIVELVGINPFEKDEIKVV